MPYSKTQWKDRAVEHPRTYTMVDNGDGTITLVPAPGTVYEQGTPVNAANLNKIEQGIADATVLAEASLPKSGGTVTGRVIAELGFDGAYSWGTFSSSSNGNAMIAQNAYLHPTDGTYRYRATHASIGARGIVFLWSIPAQAAVPHWFDMGRIATTADAVFTPTLIPLITSAGGQTFNGSMTISSTLPALRLFDTDSNNSVWLLHDNNSFYLQLRDASGNWIRDIMRLTDDGLTRKLGNDDIWHTGMLRINNGVLELYHGGVWTPVGGIKSVQRGSTTTYYYQDPPESGNYVYVNQIDVPISAVNVNKSYVVVTSGYSNGNNHSNSPGTNYRAELLNATTVRVYAAAPNNNNLEGVTVHWQVVESY